jgi:hypothetical protein
MNEERDLQMEHRLGQGLKRWAEAGQPTMDLEAFVKERTGATTPRVKARRWFRWATGGAMAAALLLSIIFTFPRWAGAAAGWPILGPVVTEIIMKDAGLKWAYENGLLQSTVASDTQDGVSLRILAVMAGPVRTTFIYQILGLPEPDRRPEAAKPIQAGRSLFSDFARPASYLPEIRFNKLPGTVSYMVSQSEPAWTPVGLVGVVTTSPLKQTEGDIELTFTVQGHELHVTIPASRAAVDNLTREVPVRQSHTIGEVTITLDAVIYSPMDTIVRYKVDKPAFNYGWGWNGGELMAYIESGQERYKTTYTYHEPAFIYQTFPVVKGPARLVFPGEVTGVDADLTWPLTPGATQQTDGLTVTLEQWERQGDRIAFQWSFPRSDRLVSFGGFDVVNEAGKTYPITAKGETFGGPQGPDSMQEKSLEADLPSDVVPVAVRVHQKAQIVWGPWSFDLPQR